MSNEHDAHMHSALMTSPVRESMIPAAPQTTAGWIA